LRAARDGIDIERDGEALGCVSEDTDGSQPVSREYVEEPTEDRGAVSYGRRTTAKFR
jgi:hypothetical protein